MRVIGTVIWFALAWSLILAVLLKHWYARQRSDQEATEEALKRTRRSTNDEHIWDAM